jgi:hypothetical protein
MKLRETSWIVVAALVFCAAAVSAQDQKPDTSPIDPNAPLQPLDTRPTGGYANKPVGAARGVAAPYDPQPYDPSQVVPDQNTLAGAAPFTLGSLQHTRNVFDPSLSFSQLAQTVPLTDGNSILTGVSIVSGSLNFNRTWSQYHFSAAYNGGETFNVGYGTASTSVGSISPHYQFHDLNVTQQIDWARWHLLISDDFTASPGAAFTAQGMGGPGLAAQFSGMLGQYRRGHALPECDPRPGGVLLQPQVGIYLLRLLRTAPFQQRRVLQQHHGGCASGLRLPARPVKFHRHPRKLRQD